MHVVFFTLFLLICCTSNKANGNDSLLESLISKANDFNSTIMRPLYALCAEQQQVNEPQQEKDQQQQHQNAPKLSADGKNKKLLCNTVHVMAKHFRIIHQGSAKAALWQAFEGIKHAVDTDLMLLMEHLHEHEASAVGIVERAMPKKVTLNLLDDYLKDKLTDLMANALKRSDGEVQMLACICLQIMKRRDDLLQQNNVATTAEEYLLLALARFSFGLWVYKALGVHGLAPIANAAATNILANYQQKQKGEGGDLRVESSAKGMGEEEQQQNDHEGQNKKKQRIIQQLAGGGK